MSKNTAIDIAINTSQFEGIIFSDDLLIDNFCNWILDELHQDQTKSYNAKEIAEKFNIPGKDLNTVIDILKEKEFIQTTFNSQNELELSLTWTSRSYLNGKFLSDPQSSSLFSAKRKVMNSITIASVVGFVIILLLALYYIFQ